MDVMVVNRDDEFFIAIGKKGIHSFVMLGVMKNNMPFLLARVGKTNSIDEDFGRGLCSQGKLAVKAIVSQTKSALQEEPLLLQGHISYSAYAIGYEHCIQFLKLIALSQRIHAINAYQPVREDDAGVVMEKKALPRAPIEEADVKQRNIIERSHSLHINNTCRSTAIDLIEYTQNISHLTDNVSSAFFRDLPVSVLFSEGKPNKYFYVFPLPPNAHDADQEKMAILTKIYKRMENLLKKDLYGENTIQKFQALKTLYNQQAGLPNGSLNEALDSIRQWRQDNQSVISQLRAQSFLGRLFVFKSSTEAMADNIENALAMGLNIY